MDKENSPESDKLLLDNEKGITVTKHKHHHEKHMKNWKMELKIPPLATDEEMGFSSADSGVSSEVLKSTELNLLPQRDPNVSAVRVRNAIKSYGDKRILKGLSMNVPKGAIYSLLGSSGCGKTTLLTCMVGIRNLDCGEIRVFGSRTGSRESGVPGRKVGFMPQEIALYGVFTIKETLQYFGTLNGMSNKEITSEAGALIEFLDLPPQSRTVGTMSGGQQRRLSLAVALIHSPELIILDEPTVGVDPLLRESIWNHLIELVTVNRVSVIITTHYIDEAKHSNMVGVMREGKILAEKTPQMLYEEYNTTLLEEIVLKLCHEDENKGAKKITSLVRLRAQEKKANEIESEEIECLFKERGNYLSASYSHSKLTLKRLKALIQKNITVTFRNFLFAIFLIIIPSVMVPIILTVASGKPRSLKMGVVNYEMNGTSCGPSLLSKTCEMEGFSCRFLDKLPKQMMTLYDYGTGSEAELEVYEARLHGYILFPDKFSESVYFKMSSDTTATGRLLNDGIMSIHMDESNPVTGPAMRQIISATYQGFVSELLSLCEFSPELAKLPFKFGEPIYGGHEDQTKEFAACGFLVGFIFFFGSVSSSVSLVWDKKQGTVERARVSGVTTWEILLAQLITEFFIVLVQVGLAFFILIVPYDTNILGSNFLALSILVLSGVMGNAHGFLFGAIANQEIEVVLLCMFSYFPGHFLSGLMWPVVNFPEWIQWVAYFLPTTLPSESIRSIVFRGLDASHHLVYEGFIGAFIWIIGLWILTICIHHYNLKKK